MRARKYFTREQLKTIALTVHRTKTEAELAEEFGVAIGAIVKSIQLLRKLGVKIPTSNGTPTSSWHQHLVYQEVARELKAKTRKPEDAQAA